MSFTLRLILLGITTKQNYTFNKDQGMMDNLFAASFKSLHADFQQFDF